MSVCPLCAVFLVRASTMEREREREISRKENSAYLLSAAER